jgi:hypothetical protein
MKKRLAILIVLLPFISCQQKIQPTDISKINGYWEIEKVVFDKGEQKDYGINDSYDYFKIEKNNTGFRKKVMPQLDGSFLVNDTQENVRIRFENNKVFFDYITPFAKWSEELTAITGEKMVFKNTENKEYFYKKTTPINITNNGKKTK